MAWDLAGMKKKCGNEDLFYCKVAERIQQQLQLPFNPTTMKNNTSAV